MFAGLDTLDSASAPFVGNLSRVKPETVHDVEAGAAYRGHDLAFSANVYSMDFRNEIAPIGAISELGAALRKNVDASYRRGIEADARVRMYSVQSDAFESVQQWITQSEDLWRRQLLAFKTFAENLQRKAKPKP